MFRLICCFWLAVSLPGMLYANECVCVCVCVAKVITENIIILITHKKS